MENDNPADLDCQRRGVDLADRIGPHTRRLRFLVGSQNLVIELMGVPANNTCAKLMRFYRLLKIVKMGGQDIDPRFRLVSAVIEAGLESVKCSLLMYILLDDMPWPIAILCILMAFTFIAN